MTPDFEPMGDGDDLWEVCDEEDEWNNALQESPEVIEREFDIYLKELKREHSGPFDGRNIYIDLYSEICATDGESIVIETQDKGSDHLDNDHAFRSLKYANESESEILVYVAESFGEYTQNLLERMNQEMDIQIFGLVPNIIPKGGGYQVGFERSISPNDWEEFREKMLLGSGIKRNRVYIFDMLNNELKQSGLPELEGRESNPVPESSGYYCDKPELEGGFEVFYSVKESVNVKNKKKIDEEFEPQNINFRLQIDDSDPDPEEICNKNDSLLNSVFDEWGVLTSIWGNSIVITVTTDLNVENHREIAQWFAQRREKLGQIDDDLTLDI